MSQNERFDDYILSEAAGNRTERRGPLWADASGGRAREIFQDEVAVKSTRVTDSRQPDNTEVIYSRLFNLQKAGIVVGIRLMTAGQVAKRSPGNVPIGTPAEVQFLFEYWGRSLGHMRFAPMPWA